MWTISYSKQATKALTKMPRNSATLIRSKIRQLAADPAAMSNVKKLIDHPGYRLRVGDWRVVYVLRQAALVIEVTVPLPEGRGFKSPQLPDQQRG